MNVQSLLLSSPPYAAVNSQPNPITPELPSPEQLKLRETFNEFVGQTFFGQLLATMRKTVSQSEYFHGGRGEEIFQAQMDQILVERLSETSAKQIAGPMFELSQLGRR